MNTAHHHHHHHRNPQRRTTMTTPEPATIAMAVLFTIRDPAALPNA